MSAIQVAATVVTYATAYVAVVFCIMYHLVTGGDWRRTVVGRHVMALAAVDAAIFLMLSAANLWPWLAVQVWYEWAYVCVVAGIAIVTVWRGLILWRLNRPRR
jgi:hypothetical protein